MDTKENQKLRAFIGIDLPKYVKEEISNLQKKLDQTSNKIRWVKKGNLHITLKFLGYVLPNKIQDICSKLSKIASQIYSFNVKLSKVGAFPKIEYPKIIWVGLENEIKEIEFLHHQLELELNKLGFQKERKKFYPHITIGRVKYLKHKPNLIGILQRAQYPVQNINVKSFSLYKSTLTSKGAIYSILNKFNLKQSS